MWYYMDRIWKALSIKDTVTCVVHTVHCTLHKHTNTSPPFHSPSPEHMLHISSLVASSSVTDMIFITAPLHSLSSATVLGPTTYEKGSSLCTCECDKLVCSLKQLFTESINAGQWVWSWCFYDRGTFCTVAGRKCWGRGAGGEGRGPFVGIEAPGKACGGSCLAGHLGHTSGHLWASRVQNALICTETKSRRKNVNKIGIRLALRWWSRWLVGLLAVQEWELESGTAV